MGTELAGEAMGVKTSKRTHDHADFGKDHTRVRGVPSSQDVSADADANSFGIDFAQSVTENIMNALKEELKGEKRKREREEEDEK